MGKLLLDGYISQMEAKNLIEWNNLTRLIVKKILHIQSYGGIERCFICLKFDHLKT